MAKRLGIIIVSAIIFQNPAILSGQTRIEISGRYAPQMNFALPLFENRGAEGERLAPELTNVLLGDLFLSGFFIPLENKKFIAEAEAADLRTGKINLAEWASLGAEILVKGSYFVSGGRISIECRAIIVSEGNQFYGKKYSGDLNRRREIIHTIADEIVFALTGEKGLARTKIAFVSARGGEKKVHIMDASGGDWRRINSGPGFALNPDWSPDGKALVYTSYSSGLPWVFWDNLSGKRRRVISSRPGLNAFPAVSPDGRWVALTLSRDGNNEIYKMRPDGTDLRRLTRSRGNDCSPAWSPDGQRIAFTSDRRGSPQIYVMDAEGKNLLRLTRGSYNSSPAWSPRSNLIAYSSLIGGNFEICVIDPTSGEVTRLTRNRFDDEDPSWAPDGRHLVYTSRQGGRSNLFVLDILIREPLQITTASECFSPAWGP